MMPFENTIEFATSLDDRDPLRKFRERFFIPSHNGKDCIYLTGNSLGLQPRTTAQYVQQELDDWAQMGVEGHFQARNPWMPYHEIFPGQISKIVGSKEQEVVVMNQLTVNLHLLMATFYRPTQPPPLMQATQRPYPPQAPSPAQGPTLTQPRYKIICEARAFPSDQYAFESQARYHGLDPEEAIIEVSPRPGEHLLHTEDIIAAIRQHGENLALVLFGGVNYYTGQYFDLPKITEAAHAVGAYAGFDLAHAVGNVELHLHDWKVDFACWCSYKYLNSGPGGVAGIYIHEKHAVKKELPRFAGWWGNDKATRFQMRKGFDAIPTAEGWQLSNAPILSMAAHKAALDIFEEAGMEALHAKRKLLSGYLHFVLNDINQKQQEKVIEVITPADEQDRGCQVSMLMLERGKEIFNTLTELGVIADWREPNVIRIAPVPLYNSFEEVWRFGNIIQNILN